MSMQDAAASTGGAWPRWADRLPPTAARRAEGGLRTKGVFKRAEPGLPLVSYVTVVRNAEKTLARTIASVIRQSHPNVEYIVVDGASTDGTLDIVLQHADAIDYFVSEPDGGLYQALNKAIELARGDLICVLNADDWLYDDAARTAARASQVARDQAQAQASKGAYMVLTAATVKGGRKELSWPPSEVQLGCYFTCANDCHNAIYASRQAYERSGPYDTGLRIAADFKWIMRCLEGGVAMHYVNEPTIYYSLGGASGDVTGHSRECVDIMLERFPFLQPEQAWEIYHSFFIFQDAARQLPQHMPADRLEAMRAICREHAGEHAFLAAMAWASLNRLEHPLDRSRLAKQARTQRRKNSINKRVAKLSQFMSRLKGSPAR